jgi:hypothetical protein
LSALRIGLVLVLAIAAAVVANIVLLGVATGSEKVGKLVPQAGLAVAPTTKPPVQTRPAQPRIEPGEHSDD